MARKPLKIPALLRWPQDKEKARELQVALAKKIRCVPLKKPPVYVAGVDAAFSGDKIICAACLYRLPGLGLVEQAHAVREVTFPYIPGLLSFREGPAIIDALKNLLIRPDVIIFDGQGIAHPKGAGIASYVGVALDIPTVGCAKSRLIGTYREPGKKRGGFTELLHEGKVVGAVVRTQDEVRPLFVSPGHRVTLEDSIRLVLACAKKYRLAEPVRCADILSKKIKRELA